MIYPMTPYTIATESFAIWENGFSENELNYLQQTAKTSNQPGFVGNGEGLGVVNPEKRRSNVSWINNVPETNWIYEKLAIIASSLNAEFFRFDLTGFGEPLQLSSYDQSINGMYGWHVDSGGHLRPCRKLSLVLQLSDPSEYEGGNFEIQIAGNKQTLRKQRGLLFAFPSYITHQVTPVISGSRQSLVAWISGPPFK